MLALLVTTLRRAYRNAECVQSAPFGPDLWVGGEIEKGLRRGGIIISRMHIYINIYICTSIIKRESFDAFVRDSEQEARIRGFEVENILFSFLLFSRMDTRMIV